MLCHFRLGTEIPVVGFNEVSVSIHQTVKLKLKQKYDCSSVKVVKPLCTFTQYQCKNNDSFY